ncbi:MAG: hypothetical protein VB034_00930 [Eubacteriales bacterium]|nr:hypothetical protein [Eubacteriales bacterium]
MKKEILSFGLFLLALFVFGCSGAAEAPTAETAGGAESGSPESAAAAESEEAEGAFLSDTVTSLPVVEEMLWEYIDPMIAADGYTRKTASLPEDETSKQIEASGITMEVYAFVDQNNDSHSGIILYKTEQGIIQLSVFCFDFANYTEEFTHLCSGIIPFIDFSWVEDYEGAEALFEETFPNDASVAANEILYSAETTAEGTKLFTATLDPVVQ